MAAAEATPELPAIALRIGETVANARPPTNRGDAATSATTDWRGRSTGELPLTAAASLPVSGGGGDAKSGDDAWSDDGDDKAEAGDAVPRSRGDEMEAVRYRIDGDDDDD